MTQSSGRLERAALIAEIVGGLAVVISVIYLALQISDNNRLLRSQSHYNALDLVQAPILVMVGNDSLAEAIYQCAREPHGASDSVWLRCSNYYNTLFNGWEYVYYQNLAETVPPELSEGYDAWFSAEVQSNAGYARFWKERAQAFAEPFHSHVEEVFRANSAVRRPTN
jgi:hypothetical protein